LKEKITLPPYTRGEEIFNMVTHIVGGAVGVVALVLCVIWSALHHSAWGVVSSSIYGFTIILLFTVSSVYHGLVPVKAKKVFRVIDHCTIYLLIAGTYTPIVLVSIRQVAPAMAWTVFGIVWGAAALAITLTAVDMQKFRVFSMICYLAMGWCVLICLKDAIESVGGMGMLLIFIGGVLYTIGAVIYLLGKKREKKYSHSVFHLFVLFACLIQFFAIFFYVI